MNPTSLRLACTIAAPVLLGVACAPPPPPAAPAPVSVQIAPPAPIQTAAPAAEPPLRPKTEGELVAVEATLREGDALYFSGRHAEARARFEAAWERHHPSPLALVMAAHAARRAGDRAGAEALLERARNEARKEPQAECAREGFGFARFDGAASAWIRGSATWARLDVRERRMLHGFCGEATRDPATRPRAPVTWMPSVLAARWQHPEPAQPGAASVGTAIDLRDLVYGGVAFAVSHTLEHWDANEEYHGALAISEDRAILASGANGPDHEVRVWRVADRSLLKALRAEHTQSLELSPDGSRLAVATCDDITLWDSAAGKRISRVDYRYIGCAYGSGVGSSVQDMAFSTDNGLLAVTHIPMGTQKHPAPESEGGSWLSIFRVRDGRRTRRWAAQVYSLRFSPDGSLVAGHSQAGALVLHDVKSGKTQELEGAGSPSAFSPDGHALVTATGVVDLSNPARAVPAMEYATASDLEQIGPYLIPRPAGR
jgi:hypothetical protein